MRDRAILVRAARSPVWKSDLPLALLAACLTTAAHAQTVGPSTEPAKQASSLTAAAGLPAAGSLAELAAQLEKSPDTVVADVNGTPITLGMVADRLHDFPEKFSVLPPGIMYKSALADLIDQRALAVKAKELGLDKLPQTTRRIQEATDRELGQALMRKILPELVTDKAIEDRYNATIAGKPGPEEVRFRVIATATEADGKIVVDRLSKGTDFGGLAQAVSKDSSALNRGEIGFASRDQLSPQIGAVVFSLQPGQTTPFPVPSNNLWFVVQVEERRQLGTPSLADSKARLTRELVQEASAEILHKSRAAVAVNDYGPTGMQGHGGNMAQKSH
jgi:peptidyl-prolyl cis-trans isomerase C